MGTVVGTASLVTSAHHRTAVAAQQPGLSYLEGLRRLVAALEREANLTPAGRGHARSALVSALVTQMQVRRMVGERPAITDTTFRPVFITGLLRTGTTFLQALLARHPLLRSPRLWELMAPASPEPASRLIERCESYVDDYYRAAPEFRTIHPLDAQEPEECHRLTANSFRHFIYALRYHVPSYVEWLRGQSMTEAYEFHRLQLQCLLQRPGSATGRSSGAGLATGMASPVTRTSGAPNLVNGARGPATGVPVDPEPTVVLKCPSHLWHLDDLATVYPDAKVIRLHRRPSVCVPSVASLTAVVRSARSDRVDRREIGGYWLHEATTALHGMRRGDAPLPTLDIRFPDLVRDPIGTAEKVCDHIGVPLTDAARTAMTSLLAHHSHAGGHDYRAEDFGLRPQAIDERFHGYIREFDL